MSDDSKIKLQRDRFLAFSFASADLFFEVSHEDVIVFALGAAKGLTGIDHETLEGINWLELFSPYEQTIIQEAMENAKPGLRCGPFIMNLAKKYGNRKAIVTGIKMPGRKSYYMTFGFSNALIEDVANKTALTNHGGILEYHDFIRSAQRVIRLLKDEGAETFVSLVYIPEFEKHIGNLGAASQNLVLDALENVLIKNSLNAANAGRLDKDHYVLVHSKTINAQTLQANLITTFQETIKDQDPLDVEIISVLSDLNSVDKTETINALTRCIDDFLKENTTLPYKGLQDALKAFKNERPNKIKRFESYIERVSFSFEFQQIINNQVSDVDHFEMLCRFEDGLDTRNWLNFAEQEGLIVPFDLAVLERAVNLIKFKDGMTKKKYAMNISAHSTLDPAFHEKFFTHLIKNKDVNKRLYFEFTCTEDIKDIKDKKLLHQFIEKLRHMNFTVILDDAAPNNPLLSDKDPIDFDFLKISATRGNQAIHNLQEYAQKRKANIIVKSVENQDRFESVQQLGIVYMQGYHFGHPSPKALVYSK